MTVERYIRIIAGFFIMFSLALGVQGRRLLTEHLAQLGHLGPELLERFLLLASRAPSHRHDTVLPRHRAFSTGMCQCTRTLRNCQGSSTSMSAGKSPGRPSRGVQSV